MQRAGAVTEIPQHQRTFLVCALRDRAHVVHGRALVVNLGQHHQRRLLADAIDQPVRRLETQRPVRHVAQRAVDDVEIAREVAGLGQHLAARGPRGERDIDELEQVRGGGIGDDDLARRGADQAGDLVADPAGCADPVAIVPAADQPDTPFLGDDVRDALAGGARQRAEGVAVEVDDVRRQVEALAECAQRIARIPAAYAGQVAGAA